MSLEKFDAFLQDGLKRSVLWLTVLAELKIILVHEVDGEVKSTC